MAKKKGGVVNIKLVSTAKKENGHPTGYFYVIQKNTRNITDKMSFRKYDPVIRKHVEFKEQKLVYKA
ncbi:MAG: large subunit ribosomal protein L33 [Candidatus Deianiraeaceae bacterium]|jgi:large subunit ribosomal protein L33